MPAEYKGLTERCDHSTIDCAQWLLIQARLFARQGRPSRQRLVRGKRGWAVPICKRKRHERIELRPGDRMTSSRVKESRGE